MFNTIRKQENCKTYFKVTIKVHIEMINLFITHAVTAFFNHERTKNGRKLNEALYAQKRT